MRPSQTILVLEDLQSQIGGLLHREEVELSLNDSQTVREIYQQWILLALDLGYLHHESLVRDARRLLTDMFAADVLDLNNAFAELLGLVRLQKIKGFKALCSRISTHLYNIIKDDVVRIPTGDVYAAKRLMQLFSYTSRLTLHEIDLTQQCLGDYMDTERNISDRGPEWLLSGLNDIIKDWMKAFDPSDLKFGHGPGGVAGHGKTSLEVKYKDLTSNELLTYVFGEPWWVTSPIPSKLDKISQTIFVPKSYKTFRTISMEPPTMQYLQQGIWKEIQRMVKADWRLRRTIDFDDQTRNQRLSQQGSVNRNYATIDLSAASDSVSYYLVKKLFRGTKILPYLIATRSPRTILPDGRLVELKKFAPMGSALCFPIETLVFASICLYVTREHRVTGDYSVYGDDIIVPTQCADDVIYCLETLGFSVNHSKSFYREDTWFRESCGTEYCDGFDVTPMRVSRKYNDPRRSYSAVGLVDLANEAYTRGYTHLRSFMIRKMRTSGIKPIFSPIAILSDSYTNYHAYRRWNPDLQKIEVAASAVEAILDEDPDEFIRYRHWLEITRDRTSVIDGFVSYVGRRTVKLKNRWWEKPYEGIDQPFIDFFTVKE